MIQPYISELRIFSFSFAPKGWALCDGQLLEIKQYQALFSLLGTSYGGDGRTTFALPDLRGRVAMHGNVLGQQGGQVSHTLIMAELTRHTHTVLASGLSANTSKPDANYFASNTGFAPYGQGVEEQMAPDAISKIGGTQPHNNMSPYAVLNICIALEGEFPSQN